MGKKSRPAPPKVFDPVKTSEAQYKYNKQAAIDQRQLNSIDQYTPYGSLVYEETGSNKNGINTNGISRLKATQSFSPEQQELYELETKAKKAYGEIGNEQLDSVRDKLSTAFTTEGLGERPIFDASGLGERPEYNEARREKTLANILERAQPGRDRQREAFRTQLVNSGFTQGTGGYKSAFDERNRSDNDFMIGADLAAGQESRNEYDQEIRARQQAYGELQSTYNTEALERDRSVNELIQERTQPLSELSSLLTGSQPKNASFVNAPQGGISAADYAGLKVGEQQALNQQYQQQLNSRNAGLGGLFDIVGTGLEGWANNGFSFSDRRLKRNIERIGTLANGLAVYAFDYIWGGARHVGLMADEVKKLHPNAVIIVGGYMAVNYYEAVL